MKKGDWYIDSSGDLCQVIDPNPDDLDMVVVNVVKSQYLPNYKIRIEYLKTPIDESLVKLILF